MKTDLIYRTTSRNRRTNRGQTTAGRAALFVAMSHLALLAALRGTPSEAHTLTVCPTGGDYATIQEAVNAASDGDTLQLCSATFSGTGNYDIQITGMSLTIMSASGDPASCVIDAQENDQIFVLSSSGGSLQGITVKGGYSDAGGSHFGGGMYISNSSPRITNCRFVGNRTDGGGAAIALEYSASPTIDHCVFEGNVGHGGPIWMRRECAPEISNCIFHDNVTDGGDAILADINCQPTILNCTFADNRFLISANGVVHVRENAHVDLTNTIISRNQGPAVYCDPAHPGTASLSCCDLFGNSEGDWVGCIADQYGLEGNFSADPLFCRPTCTGSADTSALYTLAVNSPCLPVNSPCGELVGSEGQGCDSVLVWVGAGDGKSWTDPNNWHAGRIPHAGDHVEITRGVGDRVLLTQSAMITELTLCGRGLVTDTLEIGGNGHLEVPKVRTTEEILITEGETLGGGHARLMVPGQLVVQPDTLHNLPGGEVALEVGTIGGSGALLNYDGARFVKLGISAGEVGLDFRNGGQGAPGDTAVVEVLGGTLVVSDSLVNEAMLTVEADAVLEVQDRVTNLGGGMVTLRGLLMGSGIAENYGLFQKTGSDTSSVSATLRNLRHEGEGWVGEAQVLQGTLEVQGLLENGANLTVEAGAVLDVQDQVSNLAAGVVDLRGTSRGSGAIDNLGLLRKTGSGTSSMTAGVHNLLDAGGGGGARGRIEVGEDTLAVATVDNNGIVSVAAGATLAVSDSFANRVNATVEGGGTFDVSGAAFTNDGIVSPGTSAGTLHFVGDFIQSPSAEINVDIGGTTPGTEYDVLSITGSADLSGALHVNYVGGFTPSAGDTFALIRISEAFQAPREGLREGGFQCFSGLQLPGGLFMDPVQLPEAFLLVTIDSISPNHAPSAEPDTSSTDSATPLLLQLVGNDLDTDGDPLTIATLSTETTAGEVFLNSGDTTVTYVPPFVFGGKDSFTYVVTDCKGACDSAVVTIEVDNVSDVPPDRASRAMQRLLSNYPNPFNPLTTIRYVAAAEGPVRLAIYDVRGRLVRALVNARQTAGLHTVLWDGTDDRGEPAASGIYFLRLAAGEQQQSARMVLLR